MDHFSPPYDMYQGNLTDTFVDINENATLLYKPWPSTAPSAAYNGTWANRTAQIMNVTNVTSITTSVIYPPMYEFAANPFPNTTGLAKYPDLQVTGISIDSTNGLVTFTVSRSGGGGISSLFDNRTSLVDIPFMYYNYSTDQSWETYFANAHMTEGINYMTYPIHDFRNTTRPVGTWTIYSDFTANRISASVGEPIAFTDLSLGEPTGWTIWNWSFGDGSWTNGTTKNPGHTYAAPGTYTVSMTSWLLANASITNTTTRTDYITVTPAAPDLSISINQSSIYLPLAAGSTATNQSLALNVSAGGPFTIKVEGNTGRIESQGHMGSYTNGAYDAAGPALASPLELAGTSNGTITAQTITPPILPSGSTLYTYTETAPVVNRILAPNSFSQPVVMTDLSLPSGSTYRIDLVFVITSA
jgi:PKD repeat protein